MKKYNIRCCLFATICSFAFLFPLVSNAQTGKSTPFKGHFYNSKENIHLQLDLYEPSLEVPDMNFLGKVNGYFHGNIYGIWLLTKFQIKKDVATLRFSHDSGADAQTIELKLLNDSTLSYRAINGNSVKRVHKRKLVRIPDQLEFIRKN